MKDPVPLDRQASVLREELRKAQQKAERLKASIGSRQQKLNRLLATLAMSGAVDLARHE
jgi:hypothetical protein